MYDFVFFFHYFIYMQFLLCDSLPIHEILWVSYFLPMGFLLDILEFPNDYDTLVHGFVWFHSLGDISSTRILFLRGAFYMFMFYFNISPYLFLFAQNMFNGSLMTSSYAVPIFLRRFRFLSLGWSFILSDIC